MEPSWCGWVFGENSPEQAGATQCHGAYAAHGSHPCRLRGSWCPCFGWGVRGHFWYFYKNRHQLLHTVLWLKVALVIVNLNQTQNFLLLFFILFLFHIFYPTYGGSPMVGSVWCTVPCPVSHLCSRSPGFTELKALWWFLQCNQPFLTQICTTETVDGVTFLKQFEWKMLDNFKSLWWFIR